MAQSAQHSGAASVAIVQVAGDISVRALDVDPDGAQAQQGAHYRLAAREIKARLREASGAELLFAGGSGSFSWSTEEVPVS